MPSQPSHSTRQALLDAAVSLFLGRGFDACSMDEVRVAAGASNGSLYHHFPSKAHLARAVYEEALRSYQAHLAGALGEKVDAKEGVQNLVKRHIAWVQSAPEKARVLNELRAFTAIDGREPDWDLINADTFAALQKWIARHVVEGTLLNLPFEVWMALVFGPVLQLTARWAKEGLQVPPRIANALAEAAWRSVSVRP